MSEPCSFEKNMKRLEEIVTLLESPDLSLEEALSLYKEGTQCSRLCRQELETAKHELEILQAEESSGVASIPENYIVQN